MIPFSGALFFACLVTITGCLLGEAVRLHFLHKWITAKPQWSKAFIAGLLAPVLNLFFYLVQTTAGMSPIILVDSPNVPFLFVSGMLAYAGTWIFFLFGQQTASNVWGRPR